MRNFGFFFLLFSVLGSGCVIRNNCTPNNCNGCCDATGMCLEGNTTDACGSRGAMCSACMTGTCGAGSCLNPNTGGGGTGGGAAGGVSGPTFSVVFLWNFAGQTCAQAGVSNVVVRAPFTGAAGTSFRCNTSGTDGTVMMGVPAGNFMATLEGRDAANAVRFRATTPLVVTNQDISAQVRLEPVAASGPGEVVVKWSFPPLSVSNSPTCAQATITKVRVAVNGGTPQDVNCPIGEPVGTGVRLQNLSGTVTLDLSAADMNGFVYFRKQQQVSVAAGSSTPVTVAFDWVVGSLPVRWAFSETGQTKTCAQIGATSIYLNLRTPDGTLLYPGAGAEVPCTDPMTGQATVFPYLPAGTFAVFFQAVGTGGKLFKTNQTSPPQVTVRAGQFPVLDAMTPTYTMTP